MKTVQSRLMAIMLAIILSLFSTAFAADGPPQGGGMPGAGPGAPGGAPGGPGGGPGGPGGGSTTLSPRIMITDGVRDTSGELADSEAALTVDASGTVTSNQASGIKIEASATGTSGVLVTGSGSRFTLGGSADLYTVDEGGYNSVITLDDRDVAATSQNYGSELAAGLGYGVKGGTAYLDNVYIGTVGSGRPAAYVADQGTMIIKDTYLEARGGTVSFIPGFKLIYGSCRAHLVMGGTSFLFNSVVKSNDWGALSTDTGGPNATYLYAYNTYGESTNGGYGTYSDTNCFVYLYGSTLKAGEFGAILSNSGELHADTGANVPGIVKEKMDSGDETTTNGSTIIGARNAVMVHTVDSMQSGDSAAMTFTAKLDVKDSILSTVTDLTSAGDYVDDKKVGASAPFIDRHMGSVILFRSGNAEVSLDNVKMASSNGVLLHSVPDYDDGGAVYPVDGNEALGIDVSLKEMMLEGDILHEDYQRKMTLSLSGTRLAGRIVSGTMAAWNCLWAGYSNEIQDALIQDTTYNAVWGLKMAMDADSRWVVTETSSLAGLTVEKGAAITAEEGKRLKIYTGCDMGNGNTFYDKKTGTEITALEPGRTYTGVVLEVTE